MSGIVGIWNRNGRPVEATLLSRMSDSLAHRGADGEGKWLHGPVGLACQNFWITPEALKETQPIVHSSGNVLVFDGRLDNRAELFSLLRQSGEIPAEISDAAVILEAYRAFGDRLPEKLAGDFAFALFDPGRHQLLLARDPVGVRPVYYVSINETFLFASEIKALIAHPMIKAVPDDDHLADFLLDRTDDRGRTFFKGIRSLPPSHLMVVSPEGFRSRCYWDFGPSHPVRFRSDGEYAEAFREVFQTAVSRRLRSTSPVAVSASGGLDSSSILCVARMVSRKSHHPDSNVFGVSYLTPDGSPSDEQRYLADIERENGAEILRIPTGPLRLLEGARETAWFFEAPVIDEQWGTTERTLSAVKNRGSRLLLTGHWGDQFLFSQAYLVDLVRRMRWIRAGSHLREFPRWMTDVDPKWFYRRFFVDLLTEHLPGPLITLLRGLRRGRNAPWYSDAFLRRARHRFWSRPVTRTPFASAYAASLYESVRGGYYVFCMEWNNKLAAMQGVEMAYPFLDRDLIQFMMAIPGEVHARNGVPKAILRQAMRGIVPGSILDRKWKADFTHLVNAGMNREFLDLVRCLETGRRATELGYLKERVLKEELGSLRAGLQRSDCRANWKLADLLALELWLQAFFPPVPARGGGIRSEKGAG